MTSRVLAAGLVLLVGSLLVIWATFLVACDFLCVYRDQIYSIMGVAALGIGVLFLVWGRAMALDVLDGRWKGVLGSVALGVFSVASVLGVLLRVLEER